MKMFVAYYSETGNAPQVAQAIRNEMSSQGHEVDLRVLGDITADTLNAHDLVFLGSACHDADLAKPAKQILEGLATIFMLLVPVLLRLYDRDFFRPAVILALPYAP